MPRMFFYGCCPPPAVSPSPPPPPPPPPAGGYAAFDTGQEFTGTSGADARDLHWTVKLPAEAGGAQFAAFVTNTFATGSALYISWRMSMVSDAGISHPAVYRYTSTITVDGTVDLSTFVLQAVIVVDNHINDILVNGTSSGISMDTGTATIPHALLAHGDNVITFLVQDDDADGFTNLGVHWLH